jgi:MFS transporter, ceroid-lipofuscinosis neuronal protein 7
MFVLKHFQWDLIRLGIAITVCGLIGVLFLLCFPLLLRFVKDTDLIIGGIGLMFLSCLLLVDGLFSNITEQRVYLALILMFAVGYPIGHTALIGVFSKLSRTGPQGTMLGIFGSIGSLARIVFPIVSGAVAQSFGFNFTFGFAAFMLAIAFAMMWYFGNTVHAILNVD